VLVGAEAGGGKSRLVSEFADRVRTAAGGDGPLILAGGCVEMSAAGLPYAPFTAALRELIRDWGAADVDLTARPVEAAEKAAAAAYRKLLGDQASGGQAA
jgi:hypothetical protein